MFIELNIIIIFLSILVVDSYKPLKKKFAFFQKKKKKNSNEKKNTISNSTFTRRETYYSKTTGDHQLIAVRCTNRFN